MAQPSTKQREAADTVLGAVDNFAQTSPPTQGRWYFPDGPRGTG